MNRTNNDAVRVISATGLRRLEDLWMQRFHAGLANGGNAERWFHVVLDFLSIRGDEVHPGVLVDQTHKIIERGLSQELMSALSDLVECSGCHTEYDKAVLVLTATPEQRAEAIAKVLGTGGAKP